MMVGFFILVFSCLFLGPSRLLGFPETSTVMMVFGLVVLGTGAAFTVIPVIPEMLNAVGDQYAEHQSEVSDNFSGIFNVAGGFGQIIGPTIAGLLKDEVGFNYTFDILTITVLIFNIIYILVCGGFGSIIRSVKATFLRCRKAPETPDQTTHHLLAEESDTQDDTINSSSEFAPKLAKHDDENGNEGFNSSTDISQTNNNSYTIN
uniref:Major facilitator superfamily (MFS) profile domain-containing protein n=1 Tax=Euplotes harpa TaxID=151035 RepID=A0A7S3NA97_9SPIT|mmetsp:Transcript_29013/g.33138  ORF Transcript_29013/g.33138 Transcript_29013/m.33138 type:complete len:205 (+) Transcript_29013:844-1458(+)